MKLRLLLLLFLVAPLPAVAGFIPGFEPVWEKYGRPGGAAVVSVGRAGSGAGFTDPTTGMEFVLVKGGCFQMDSNDGVFDEKPVHEVCVDDFYIGKTEVTQGQWQKLTGSNPANFKKGDNYPVEQVTWNDVQDYLRQLNQKSGKSYRLPTEAEWEYAARSGGKKEKYAGGDNVEAVAWYGSNSGSSTHPIGQKQANGLGLFDMSGNVWEWCSDWSGDTYYAESPKNNPQGPSGGSDRVYRGGSWYDGPDDVRSTNRGGGEPVGHSIALGFRLALPAIDTMTRPATISGNNLSPDEKYLWENARKAGVVTLPSGLQYKVLTPGTGKIPNAKDRVTVHYRGTLIDGKEFDSSFKRGQPLTFALEAVIPGWTEVLQLMQEGATWEVAIPAKLAYGERCRFGDPSECYADLRDSADQG